MAITKTWEPALTHNGYSIGKFINVMEKTHVRDNGEEFSVLNAYFEIMGKNGETKEIPYRLTETYHPDNRWGLFSKALGFEYKEVLESNEKGLRMIVKDNLDELDKILDNAIGKEFKMMVTRNIQTNLYDIQIETLSGLSESSKMSAGKLD